MSTHPQQDMWSLLSSNSWTLDGITRTEEALAAAKGKLCVPAWKRQKPGHLYALAVLRNYNYDDIVSPAPMMKVETALRGAAAESTIFSNTHRDGDTFRVPLPLLTTMEEAIARHATDVASSTTTSAPPAG